MFARTLDLWRRWVGGDELTDTPGTAVAEAERRVWIRHPANLRATLQPSGEDHRVAATVRDISRGGAHLVVGQLFEPGDLVSLEIPRADAQALNVLACIVRVSAQAGGAWTLGCIFSRELNDDDLRDFGAKRQKHTADDQRTWMRFPCDVHACYERVGENGERRTAQVLNISANGVGLLADERVETGTLLSVELHAADDGAGPVTRTILACVVHTAEKAGLQALGCNFIRELEENELQGLVSQ